MKLDTDRRCKKEKKNINGSNRAREKIHDELHPNSSETNQLGNLDLLQRAICSNKVNNSR